MIVVDAHGRARRLLAEAVADIWAGGTPGADVRALLFDDKDVEQVCTHVGIDVGELRQRVVAAEALAPAERDRALLLLLKEVEDGEDC
jgi:hypothetical protein